MRAGHGHRAPAAEGHRVRQRAVPPRGHLRHVAAGLRDHLGPERRDRAPPAAPGGGPEPRRPRGPAAAAHARAPSKIATADATASCEPASASAAAALSRSRTEAPVRSSDSSSSSAPPPPILDVAAAAYRRIFSESSVSSWRSHACAADLRAPPFSVCSAFRWGGVTAAAGSAAPAPPVGATTPVSSGLVATQVGEAPERASTVAVLQEPTAERASGVAPAAAHAGAEIVRGGSAAAARAEQTSSDASRRARALVLIGRPEMPRGSGRMTSLVWAQSIAARLAI